MVCFSHMQINGEYLALPTRVMDPLGLAPFEGELLPHDPEAKVLEKNWSGMTNRAITGGEW